MNYLNTDFAAGEAKSSSREMREFYRENFAEALAQPGKENASDKFIPDEEEDWAVTSMLKKTLVLSERSAKNYARNLLAYGVRAGMYLGVLFQFELSYFGLSDIYSLQEWV